MTAWHDTTDLRFGAQVAARRAERRWSMRELCGKAGLPSAPSVIHRIENGGSTSLGIAVRVASALGLSLDSLHDAPSCARCGDAPPPGYTCNACGMTAGCVDEEGDAEAAAGAGS